MQQQQQQRQQQKRGNKEIDGIRRNKKINFK